MAESLKPVEFGLLLPVANNGWIMSKTSRQYMPTYELNKNISLLAEEIGLHYVFAMGKWRGLGGETKLWNYTAEPKQVNHNGKTLSAGRLHVRSQASPAATSADCLRHFFGSRVPVRGRALRLMTDRSKPRKTKP